MYRAKYQKMREIKRFESGTRIIFLIHVIKVKEAERLSNAFIPVTELEGGKREFWAQKSRVPVRLSKPFNGPKQIHPRYRGD